MHANVRFQAAEPSKILCTQATLILVPIFDEKLLNLFTCQEREHG